MTTSLCPWGLAITNILRIKLPVKTTDVSVSPKASKARFLILVTYLELTAWKLYKTKSDFFLKTEVLDLVSLRTKGKNVSMLSLTAKYLIIVSAIITTKILSDWRSFIIVLFMSNCNSSPGLTSMAASRYDNFLI